MKTNTGKAIYAKLRSSTVLLRAKVTEAALVEPILGSQSEGASPVITGAVLACLESFGPSVVENSLDLLGTLCDSSVIARMKLADSLSVKVRAELSEIAAARGGATVMEAAAVLCAAGVCQVDGDVVSVLIESGLGNPVEMENTITLLIDASMFVLQDRGPFEDVCTEIANRTVPALNDGVGASPTSVPVPFPESIVCEEAPQYAAEAEPTLSLPEQPAADSRIQVNPDAKQEPAIETGGADIGEDALITAVIPCLASEKAGASELPRAPESPPPQETQFVRQVLDDELIDMYLAEEPGSLLAYAQEFMAESSLENPRDLKESDPELFHAIRCLQLVNDLRPVQAKNGNARKQRPGLPEGLDSTELRSVKLKGVEISQLQMYQLICVECFGIGGGKPMINNIYAPACSLQSNLAKRLDATHMKLFRKCWRKMCNSGAIQMRKSNRTSSLSPNPESVTDPEVRSAIDWALDEQRRIKNGHSSEPPADANEKA